MKTKDIARRYGVKQHTFEAFLRDKGVGQTGLGGMNLEDHLVQQYVDEFNALWKSRELEQNVSVEDYKKKQQEEQEAEIEKQKACAAMLISSGFSFDGYKIVKYSGYISGDDAVQIPRTGWFGGSNTGQMLTDALVKIRRQAIKELKEAAYDLGCNAVVGVDFDYITMDPQTATINGGTKYEPYVICVTANGNAVVIEKDE